MNATLRRSHAQLIVILLAVPLASCSHQTTVSATVRPSLTTSSVESAFCQALRDLAVQLEPASKTPTPAAERIRYQTVAAILDRAQLAAPTTLAHSVAVYSTAIDRYSAALAAVDYDLDALFKTPAGRQLAVATSHALAPALVDYLTGPCALPLTARSPST